MENKPTSILTAFPKAESEPPSQLHFPFRLKWDSQIEKLQGGLIQSLSQTKPANRMSIFFYKILK
jgi:hypothetical protein